MGAVWPAAVWGQPWRGGWRWRAHRGGYEAATSMTERVPPRHGPSPPPSRQRVLAPVGVWLRWDLWRLLCNWRARSSDARPVSTCRGGVHVSAQTALASSGWSCRRIVLPSVVLGAVNCVPILSSPTPSEAATAAAAAAAALMAATGASMVGGKGVVPAPPAGTGLLVAVTNGWPGRLDGRPPDGCGSQRRSGREVYAAAPPPLATSELAWTGITGRPPSLDGDRATAATTTSCPVAAVTAPATRRGGDGRSHHGSSGQGGGGGWGGCGRGGEGG